MDDHNDDSTPSRDEVLNIINNADLDQSCVRETSQAAYDEIKEKGLLKKLTLATYEIVHQHGPNDHKSGAGLFNATPH